VCQQSFRGHEDGCVEQLVNHTSKRKTTVLRPVVDLGQDQVYSDASLSIGQDNVFRTQQNKDLYFQRDFLLSLFKNNGGPKIRERDIQIRMVVTFKDKDEDSDFSVRLVLSESQSSRGFRPREGVGRKRQ
jgi:hypothetical protein